MELAGSVAMRLAWRQQDQAARRYSWSTPPRRSTRSTAFPLSNCCKVKGAKMCTASPCQLAELRRWSRPHLRSVGTTCSAGSSTSTDRSRHSRQRPCVLGLSPTSVVVPDTRRQRHLRGGTGSRFVLRLGTAGRPRLWSAPWGPAGGHGPSPRCTFWRPSPETISRLATINGYGR